MHCRWLILLAACASLAVLADGLAGCSMAASDVSVRRLTYRVYGISVDLPPFGSFAEEAKQQKDNRDNKWAYLPVLGVQLSRDGRPRASAFVNCLPARGAGKVVQELEQSTSTLSWKLKDRIGEAEVVESENTHKGKYNLAVEICRVDFNLLVTCQSDATDRDLFHGTLRAAIDSVRAARGSQDNGWTGPVYHDEALDLHVDLPAFAVNNADREWIGAQFRSREPRTSLYLMEIRRGPLPTISEAINRCGKSPAGLALLGKGETQDKVWVWLEASDGDGMQLLNKYWHKRGHTLRFFAGEASRSADRPILEEEPVRSVVKSLRFEP